MKDAVVAIETVLGITGAFNFVTDAEMTTHEGNPTDLHHLTDVQLGALHTAVVAGDLNHNDLASIDAGDIKHITAAQLGALHTVVVAGDFNHNDLANINAGDNYEHITQTQKDALHAAAHALAVTGPHTGTLPLADLAVGTSGSIIIRGAADWQELAKGSDTDVLTLASGLPAWAAQGAPGAHDIITTHTDTGLTIGHVIIATAPTTFAWGKLSHTALDDIGSNAHSVIDTHLGEPPLIPSSNLVTINSRKAMLLFQDDYDLDKYNDLEKPLFWVIDGDSDGAESANDYFRIDNTNHDLRWRSWVDIISTQFDPPKTLPRMIVIEFEDFFYDDIGGSDIWTFYIHANIWDNSAGKVVRRTIAGIQGKNNIYYHLSDGAWVNTGWGNPETLGHHTLRFFVAPMCYVASGKRSYYRIECTGKTAVTGHQNTIFDDDQDDFIGWPTWAIGPSLSAGWDILAHLDKIKIYARDNHDL